MRTPLAVGLLSLVGCATEPREPVEPAEPLARVDLRLAMNDANPTPVGFALAPDGTRFILDEAKGLLRLEASGEAVQVVSMSDMPDPGPTAPLQLPFTDIVAYAPNVFAMTAIGDGYLLDIDKMTLTQKFCYVPDGNGNGEGGGPVPMIIKQRTDAVTYDTVFGKFWAQPITLDAVDTFVRSEVARYNAATGEDDTWIRVDDSMVATAMYAYGSNLLLAQGSQLTRKVLNSLIDDHVVDDLARFGVQSIDGMTIDRENNRMIVVDKVTDTMVDIDLADVTLEF